MGNNAAMKEKVFHNKSFLNLITGVGYQVINTILGLILPHLFITEFGSETNGLLSSVAQLFIYLELLEGGVSVASTQALYRPLSQDNKGEISAIMAATRRYFYRTGAVYGGLVVLLAFAYPFVVRSSLSRSTVFKVVALQGAGHVFSYLVQGSYVPLLKAEGRSYVQNMLYLGSSILRNAGKIIAIAMGCDVVVVQAIHLVITVLQVLCIATYARKKYKWLDRKVKPDYTAIAQKDSVLIQHVAWLVFNHTDIMILTLIVKDLALVSVYSIYSLVFSAIQNVMDSIVNALQHKLGRTALEGQHALLSYFDRYESVQFALSFSLYTIAFLLVKPFINLYVGDVADADYLMPGLAGLFFSMKCLNMVRQANSKMIEAVGHFKRTQKIAFVEMVINLGVSIILTPAFGIYGVLCGTIVALIYSVFNYSRYVDGVILNVSAIRTLKILLPCMCTALVVCCFGSRFIIMSQSYFELVMQACVVAVLVCIPFGIVLFFEWSFKKVHVHKR